MGRGVTESRLGGVGRREGDDVGEEAGVARQIAGAA